MKLCAWTLSANSNITEYLLCASYWSHALHIFIKSWWHSCDVWIPLLNPALWTRRQAKRFSRSKWNLGSLFSFRLESREKLVIHMHVGFMWGAHGMKRWPCCQAQGRPSVGWLLGMEILLAEDLPSGLWSKFQQHHLEVMLNRMWQERISPSWSLGCSLEPHLRLLLSLHTALQSCCSEKGWQEPYSCSEWCREWGQEEKVILEMCDQAVCR